VSVSAPITITPSTALSIRFLPSAPSQLQAGSTVLLNAAVTNDSSNKGVNWQVCASGCGFFTTTPAIPAIAATKVAPYQPAVPAVTSTTVSGWPNGLPISYTAPATAGTNGALSVSVAAHANSSTAAAASITIVNSGQGPALLGTVRAGSAPVVGSAVSLYAAGTSGYGSASTLLYSPSSSPSSTTDNNGKFTLSGGYTCPQASSEVYLVASGGKVGTNGNNPNLTLMTALGPCGALSSSPVVVNEVTTVASAWALANFEVNDPLTGNSSYLNLGTSSGNTTGLASAFAAVNNLVDITTGTALFVVPAGNAAVPYAEINTIADVLNTCTSTGGGVEGDGSACGNLFSHADPLTGGPILNPTPPADTLQAAINIAQHPDGQFGYAITAPAIFSLLGTSQPFQPVLNAQPNDFSISLNYTGGGGLTASSSANFFALDGSGNVWITDTTHNRAIEWNNEGTPVSIAGFTDSSLLAPGPVAVDSAGHVWTCDNDGLTELTTLGTEALGSPFVGGGITNGCEGMAFDGLGNLWVSNSSSVSEFDNLGIAVSPASGFSIPVSPTDSTPVALQPPIAIDDSNNVWVGVTNPTNPGGQYLAQLNNNGVASLLNPVTVGATPASYFVAASSIGGQTQIAISHGGDVWVPVGGTNTAGLNEVLPYAGVGTTDLVTQVFSGSNNSTDNPFTQPNGVAIDGAGMVWVPSIGNAQIQAGLTEIDPSDAAAFADFAAPSLASPALNAAVDGSGNIWVLLSGNTLTEYIGLATPAVTPLSAAVKAKKLGSTP
jgi:sugar lactone lactonase YvrE